MLLYWIRLRVQPMNSDAVVQSFCVSIYFHILSKLKLKTKGGLKLSYKFFYQVHGLFIIHEAQNVLSIQTTKTNQGVWWLTSLWWGLWRENETVAYEVNCTFSWLFHLLCWTFSHPTELSSSFLKFPFGKAKNRIKIGRAEESWSG